MWVAIDQPGIRVLDGGAAQPNLAGRRPRAAAPRDRAEEAQAPVVAPRHSDPVVRTGLCSPP
jgi:hypothetical protein